MKGCVSKAPLIIWLRGRKKGKKKIVKSIPWSESFLTYPFISDESHPWFQQSNLLFVKILSSLVEWILSPCFLMKSVSYCKTHADLLNTLWMAIFKTVGT